MNKFLKLTLLSTVMLPSVMATDSFQPYYTLQSQNDVKQQQSKKESKKEYSFFEKNKAFDIVLNEKNTLETKVSNLTSQIEIMAKQLDELTGQNRDLLQQSEFLGNNFTASEEKNIQLKTQLTESTEQNRDLNTQALKLTSQIENMTKQLGVFDEQKTSLQQVNNDLVVKVKSVEEQNTQLEIQAKRLPELKNQIDNLQKQIMDINQKNAELLQKNKLFETKLTKSEDQIMQLTKQLEASNDQNDRWQKENEQLKKTKNEDMRKLMAKFEEELQDLRDAQNPNLTNDELRKLFFTTGLLGLRGKYTGSELSFEELCSKLSEIDKLTYYISDNDIFYLYKNSFNILVRAINSGKLPNLKNFSFSSDEKTDMEIKFLINTLNLSQFESLSFASRNICAEDVKALAEGLKRCKLSQLRTLNLELHLFSKVGGIDAEAIKALIDVDLSQLQTLNLKGINIGDSGAKVLADAIMSGKLPQLQTLNLEHNNIGAEGARALADAIAKSKEPALVTNSKFGR